MARRRKKPPQRVPPLSAGPLPAKLAARFPVGPWIFSDASKLHRGGLAAVLYRDDVSEPTVATCSVAPVGSNALELLAALFALSEAGRHFPGLGGTLFSDNRDAVDRLQRAKSHGLAADPELATLPEAAGLGELLARIEICWVPGHAACRGNALADLHARAAAA